MSPKRKFKREYFLFNNRGWGGGVLRRGGTVVYAEAERVSRGRGGGVNIYFGAEMSTK